MDPQIPPRLLSSCLTSLAAFRHFWGGCVPALQAAEMVGGSKPLGESVFAVHAVAGAAAISASAVAVYPLDTVKTLLQVSALTHFFSLCCCAVAFSGSDFGICAVFSCLYSWERRGRSRRWGSGRWWTGSWPLPALQVWLVARLIDIFDIGSWELSIAVGKFVLHPDLHCY